MTKITAIVPQKRNAYKFNVFLDGKFAFAAGKELLERLKIEQGKELAVNDAQEFSQEAEIDKLVLRIYRFLSIRQRSEKEVRDYFREKQISDVFINLVIRRLEEKGLINDLEFAKNWVESRRTGRKIGLARLKRELLQKGVCKQIAEEVLAGVPKGSEQELAVAALGKKMRIWQGLPKLKLISKSYQYLVRKGFSYEVARRAIEKLGADDI